MPQNNHIMQSYTDLLTVNENTPEHEYRGIAPITVDNVYDTISIDNAAITKLQSTETVQVTETTDRYGHTVYQMQASDNGTPFQTELHAGDNIKINSENNVISVDRKRKLVIDAPLYKTVDQNDVHIGIDQIPTSAYTYYAGKNLSLNNYTFDCNGQVFDYGYSNSVSGIENYVIGRENSATNTSASIRPNIVLGYQNNVGSSGYATVIGQNNEADTLLNCKAFAFGRNLYVNSTLNDSYGAFAIGNGVSASDNNLIIGFPNCNAQLDNARLLAKVQATTCNVGYSNNVTGIENYVFGKDNTVTNTNDSIRPNVAIGYNNTIGNYGNSVAIGQNNYATAALDCKAFTFGRNLSAVASISDSYGAFAIGNGVSATDNRVVIGFPATNIKIGLHEITVTEDGISKHLHTYNQVKYAQLDGNYVASIVFDTHENIMYGSVVCTFTVNTATTVQVKLYGPNNVVYESISISVQPGQFTKTNTSFTNYDITKVEIIGDANIAAADANGLYAHIYGITQ